MKKISLGDRMAIAGTLRLLGDDSGQAIIDKKEANRLADLITPSSEEILAVVKPRKPIAKIAEGKA
jgi:hypothetical protein